METLAFDAFGEPMKIVPTAIHLPDGSVDWVCIKVSGSGIDWKAQVMGFHPPKSDAPLAPLLARYMACNAPTEQAAIAEAVAHYRECWS